MTDEPRPIRQISGNFEKFQAGWAESLKYLTIWLQSSGGTAPLLSTGKKGTAAGLCPVNQQLREIRSRYGVMR